MRQLLVTLALVLSSCVPSRSPEGTAARRIVVTDSEFEGQIQIRGVAAFTIPGDDVRDSTNDSYSHFLRSWISKSDGATRHQLAIDNEYRAADWRRWSAANDDHAKPLELIGYGGQVVDCSLGPCALTEIVGISLEDGYLREHATGFRVKLSSQSGQQQILEVTAEQVGTQLQKTDSILAARGHRLKSHR